MAIKSTSREVIQLDLKYQAEVSQGTAIGKRLAKGLNLAVRQQVLGIIEEIRADELVSDALSVGIQNGFESEESIALSIRKSEGVA